MDSSFTVYILQDAEGGFHVGYSGNLNPRVVAHSRGLGGILTKKLPLLRLVYSEPCETLAGAVKREPQLKGWTRAKKVALIQGKRDRLKALSKSRDH
jgi:putative endonuclease